MAILTKLISMMVSFIMMLLNLFGIGIDQRPEFVLGENVNSNAQEVLAVYNAAVIKTDEDAPLIESRMHIVDLTMGNGSGGTISFAKPLMEDIFEETVYESYDIPGEGLLAADDVISAKSSSENGWTTVIIEVKDQVDGVNADAYNGGPVSRAVGTLGDMEAVFELIGFECVSGKETIKFTYTDCTISCIIDEATGEIIYGEWTFDVCAAIGSAEFKMDEMVVEFEDLDADFSYVATL